MADQSESASGPVASGAKPPTKPVFVGNKTFGRIKSLTAATPSSKTEEIAIQAAGGLVGAGQSMLDTALGLARVGNNSILQIGDILTLGLNHDSALMQQVWVEQGALAAGVVRAVTETGQVINDIGSSLSSRAAEAEALRAAGETFQAAIIDGQLGGDVGQVVLGGVSAMRAVGSKMLGAARGLRGAVAEPLPAPIEPIPEPVPAAPKPKTGPGNGAYVEKPRKPPPNGFKGPDAYKTHGYKGKPTDTPEGRRLVQEFEKQGYSPMEAADKASDLMETGVNPPLANPTEIGDRLYKVVPEGKMPGANSEFWSTRQEIDSLQGMSRDAIADKLGLPLESQQAPRFDVVEIKATQPTTTFSSQIAPTSQNGWLQDGGKIQTLVTDRGAFTPPVSTGIKLP